jgi:copper chaperone CopZ
MTKILLTCSVLLSLVVFGRAADPTNSDTPKATSATYLITGLHCPPCTSTVERSLSKSAGIRSIKVDWNTKNAKIEFDESTIPAQKVAELIAATPHMMGPSMHYDSWLALKAADVKDDASAKVAKDALSKVAGVKKAEAFPAQHIVEVQFAADGAATSAQLIDALAGAGIQAANY